MIRLAGGPSIDWSQFYAIPQPTSPAFFMEDYTSPSPPVPPSSSLLVPTLSSLPVPTIPTSQSAPPALPRAQDRSSEAPASGTKSQQKTPEAGPSIKPAQAKESELKGRKREGDSIETRPKKTRIVSAKYINDSNEDTVKVKSESPTPAGAMSGLKVFVEIPP